MITAAAVCLPEPLAAEPGWSNGRSWEFWRGRLALRTGQAIPEEPPRRSFDDDPV